MYLYDRSGADHNTSYCRVATNKIMTFGKQGSETNVISNINKGFTMNTVISQKYHWGVL